MEFCPKCGSIMMIKNKKLVCPRCNYTKKADGSLEIKEEIKSKSPVAFIDEKDGEMLPITEFECPKCGTKTAYFWQRQMRAGDEPESKFYKCTKCKNVVRED
jgi:transcription factor S